MRSSVQLCFNVILCECMSAQDNQIELQMRLESLYQWITNNKALICQTDKVRITLNVKGMRVVGEVTQCPEN